jgi:hypothetical protein
MNTEPLGELAGLVVLFDHRWSIKLEGKRHTIAKSERGILAKVLALLDMRAVG